MLWEKEPTPITILVDNEGSNASSNYASINQRDKKIDMHYQVVRESV